MQISSLTDIVEGVLINTPSISFITQTHLNPHKVNEGDAFFTHNPEQIEIALAKGAFAIIYDFETDILDAEIAWIRVPNFLKAVTNILRYTLLEHESQFIQTDSIVFRLLRTLKNKELSHFVFLQKDLYKNFEMLNTTEHNTVVIGTNSDFLEALSGNVTLLENKHFEIQNLTIHSLFETSFSYKGRFFDKLKLPALYLHSLLSILEFFEYNFDLKKLQNTPLLKPIFVNKSKQIVPYGQTNRFIIGNVDDAIASMEIEYLYEYYSYGDIKILDTKDLKEDAIFEQIKKLSFNALYCKGISFEKLTIILEKNHTIETLL